MSNKIDLIDNVWGNRLPVSNKRKIKDSYMGNSAFSV